MIRIDAAARPALTISVSGMVSVSYTATRITAPTVTATYRTSPINRHGDVAIGLVGVGGLFNGGSAEPGSEPSSYPPVRSGVSTAATTCDSRSPRRRLLSSGLDSEPEGLR